MTARSRDVAFNHLLADGNAFADRLRNALDHGRDEPQLVHIATDGETYGHHHRFGDMALARAVKDLEADPDVRLTVYGEYLEQHPPEWEAQVVEDSSWSCEHGVERWRSNCGCNAGRNRAWSQHWRAPLRNAFDWLRDNANPLFEREAAAVFKDPWAARDAYIDVALDRSERQVAAFMAKYLSKQGRTAGHEKALKLMELQRRLMLIYTSCGWFFDELSGIETVQVIEYAGRALQLADELFGPELEQGFLEQMQKAQSNLREHGDGRRIYERLVRPSALDLRGVAAHFAIGSLFDRETGGPKTSPAYDVSFEDWTECRSEPLRLVTGIISVRSRTTAESGRFEAAVFHSGGQEVTCGLIPFESSQRHEAVSGRLEELVLADDPPAVEAAMQETFGDSLFTLQDLSLDDQRHTLEQVLKSVTAETEGVYEALYGQQLPALRSLQELNSPIPQPFMSAAEYFLNTILRNELERTDRLADATWLRARLEEAQAVGIELDSRGLGFLLEREIHEMLDTFRNRETTTEDLARLEATVDLAKNGPLLVDLWDAQATVYQMSRQDYVQAVEDARKGDRDSQRWAALFESLAQHVSVRLPDVEQKSRRATA